MSLLSHSLAVSDVIKSGQIRRTDLIKVLEIINKCRLAQTIGEVEKVVEDVRQLLCHSTYLSTCPQSRVQCAAGGSGSADCPSGGFGAGEDENPDSESMESIISTDAEEFTFRVESKSFAVCHFLKPGSKAMCLTGRTDDCELRFEHYLLMTYFIPHFHESWLRISGASARGPQLEHRPLTQAGEFTHRERDVVQWLALGKTNWEIGMILGISERTVKFHLNNVFQKLGVANRAQAVLQANRLGLIENTLVNAHG